MSSKLFQLFLKYSSLHFKLSVHACIWIGYMHDFAWLYLFWKENCNVENYILVYWQPVLFKYFPSGNKRSLLFYTSTYIWPSETGILCGVLVLPYTFCLLLTLKWQKPISIRYFVYVTDIGLALARNVFFQLHMNQSSSKFKSILQN